MRPNIRVERAVVACRAKVGVANNHPAPCQLAETDDPFLAIVSACVFNLNG
jgi:hypothetical protein